VLFGAGGELMRANRSISEIVARLEAQAVVHRDREAYHAEQEELHRRQRTHHAAELEQITRRLEAFQAASAAVLELADRIVAPEPTEDGEDLGPAYRPKLGRMATKVIDALGAADRFGPALVTREVNRRFGKGLRKPVQLRQISVVLRRMHRYGRIHLVRQGRPHREALYSRTAPEVGRP
jgi:hypothetical protein